MSLPWKVLAIIPACATVVMCGDSTGVKDEDTEQRHRLTVAVLGTAEGTVTSRPSGIDCGMSCEGSYPHGVTVVLQPTALAGARFAGWGDDCSGTSECRLTMTAAMKATATFDALAPSLNVVPAGTGSGMVSSAAGLIDCGEKCRHSFVFGADVALTATATGGSVFEGWSGACTGSQSVCQVSMREEQYVVATFSKPGTTLGLGFGPEQFALIQAGTFQMGCDLSTNSLDKPAHLVTLTRPFRIQKTEVTQAQWREVMGANPSNFRCGDTCPVERVSWADVRQFIVRLNGLDPGKGYRLPTEAEWEYAARAGTTGDTGGSEHLGDMAWYESNSGMTTHPVALKLPNHWGLYDMIGNVQEWTQDWFIETWTGQLRTDPAGAPGPTGYNNARILRGGCYASPPHIARTARRNGGSSDGQWSNIGFRLVMQP
jgi:formylglycine-generating enzyme required for sulfatase activity